MRKVTLIDQRAMEENAKDLQIAALQAELAARKYEHSADNRDSEETIAHWKARAEAAEARARELAAEAAIDGDYNAGVEAAALLVDDLIENDPLLLSRVAAEIRKLKKVTP